MQWSSVCSRTHADKATSFSHLYFGLKRVTCCYLCIVIKMQKSHGACLPCSHVLYGLGSLLKQWHQKHQIKGKACNNLSHSLVQHVCTHNTCMQTAHTVWQSKLKLVRTGLVSINLQFLNSSPSETIRQLLPLLMCEATLRIHWVGLHYWKESFSHQLIVHVRVCWLTPSNAYSVKTHESCQHLWAQRWEN